MKIEMQEIETAYRAAIEGMGYDLKGFSAINTLDPVLGHVDEDIADAILALPYEEAHALARRICGGYCHIAE